MKLRPFPKLKETRLAQIWFVFSQVFRLSWQVSPKLLVADLVTNILVGFLIYPTLKLERAFIDTLIDNIGSDFWGLAGRTIMVILFLRFVVGIAQDIFIRAGNYFRRIMSRIFSTHITMLIAKKNAELDMTILDSPDFRDRYNKIRRESSRRAWGMMTPISQVPMALAGLISTLVIISSFNWLVGLAIFLLSIPIFIVDAKYIKKEYRFSEEASPLWRIWYWLQGYLLRPRNMLEIKLLKLYAPFSERMSRIHNQIFSRRIKIEKARTITQSLVGFPQNVFYLVVSIYLAFFVFAKKLTVGSAEMILRAIGSFRGNLTLLVSQILELYENYLYVADLVWLLSLKPSTERTQKGKVLGKILGKGIEFKDVWFRYTDQGPWVLKDINLKINPTENMAIVGENGAGKSTLVKLICRFYDPQRGNILLNGIDLKKYSIESLWENLSVLFQDFETYPFSAKESIGYGDNKKSKKTDLIKRAAKRAEVDDYLKSLPLKYKNPLDPSFEKGVRPSFGQWQRIALARVFLKDAAIVILDEPTSNVDPKAEEQIFKKIIKDFQKRMVILISHRFSTVRRADNIYVVDKGRIIEGGRHENLMKKGGHYAQLFEIQAKGYR